MTKTNANTAVTNITPADLTYDITKELQAERHNSAKISKVRAETWATTVEAVEDRNKILGYMAAAEAQPWITTSYQTEEMDEETAERMAVLFEAISKIRHEVKRYKKSKYMDSEMRKAAISALYAELKKLMPEWKKLNQRFSLRDALEYDEDNQEIPVTYIDHIQDTNTEEQLDVSDTIQSLADEHVVQMEMEEAIMDGRMGGTDTDLWQYRHYENMRSRVWKIVKRGKAIGKEIEAEKAKLAKYKDKKREEWKEAVVTGTTGNILALVKRREAKTLKAIAKLEEERKELRAAFKYLACRCGWSSDKKAWGRMMFINNHIVGMPEVWYRKASEKQLLTWANMKEEERMELKRKHFVK